MGGANRWNSQVMRIGPIYSSAHKEFFVFFSGGNMKFTIETELENDGRWIAEIVELPGVMKYGSTRAEAISHAEALALRVMADRIESGEREATPLHIAFEPA
jgi:predicted RNase H-like HicB family nuclease